MSAPAGCAHAHRVQVAPALARTYAVEAFPVRNVRVLLVAWLTALAIQVPASMHSAVSGDSGRYAIKLYDITAKDNSIDAVSKDLDEVRCHHRVHYCCRGGCTTPTLAQLAVALPDVKFLNYISVPLPEKLKSLEAEVYKTKKTHPLAKDFVGMVISCLTV